MKTLILIIVLAAFLAFISGCENRGEAVILEVKAQDIYRSLMCPLCPGQTLAESQTALSQQMRSIVQEKLSQGATKEEILGFFVERYGEGVLAAPPKTGLNLLLWIVPYVAMVAGGFLLLRLILALKQKAKSVKIQRESMSEGERQYWEERLRAEMNKGGKV